MALPGGTSQVNAGIAVPAPEVTSLTEQSANGPVLQVLPPKVVVSQTKRMRLPAGGVIVSVILTPVA